MTCGEPSKTFHGWLMFGLILVSTPLFVGESAAEPVKPPAPAVRSHPAGPHALCSSLSDCDRRAYGYSGTRGRMGLGADPAHPEGPGNAPN